MQASWTSLVAEVTTITEQPRTRPQEPHPLLANQVQLLSTLESAEKCKLGKLHCCLFQRLKSTFYKMLLNRVSVVWWKKLQRGKTEILNSLHGSCHHINHYVSFFWAMYGSALWRLLAKFSLKLSTLHIVFVD